MEFLHSEANTRAIKKLFSHGGQIHCAVSFWGSSASDYIAGDVERIKIVCNLESGATNPYLIESLIENGVKVKSNPKLHAKVYIAENKCAIIGSSNASANGLSFENEELDGWVEASVLVNSSDTLAEISDWFTHQWRSSRKINSSMLETAKAKWSKRRNRRELTRQGKTLSILDALKKAPQQFKDKNIYISIYRIPKASEEAVEAFEQAKKQVSIENKLSFWEGWPELPENALFISIYYGPRGRFSFEGYFSVPQDKSEYIEEFEYANGESGNILICFLENSIEGLVIEEKDKDLLHQHIQKLWQSANPESKDEGVFLPLYEAKKILFPRARITKPSSGRAKGARR